MNRHISLVHFTEKGAAGMKESSDRAATFASKAKLLGVEVVAQYWSTGPIDGFLILEGEFAAVLRCLADLNAEGFVRTETHPAIDAGEFRRITNG